MDVARPVPPGNVVGVAFRKDVVPIRQVRVFLSSPGDVADERQLARDVIRDLVAEPFLRERAMVKIVAWDDPAAPVPMLGDRTPQESVNRFLPKPSECDIVVVVLWSRLGTPLPGQYRRADGRRYLSGTEWEYEDALNATPRPNILVYRRTEKVLLDPDTADFVDRVEAHNRVKQFFERFRDADGSQEIGVANYASPSEFANRLRTDLRELISAHLRLPPPRVNESTSADPIAVVLHPWTGLPYPGLRSFTTDEAAIFFGRGQEVDALILRLRPPTQRFLALVGASGSGKSSLVRAGLLPRLAAGAVEGSQHWKVLGFTPGAFGDNPLLALSSELRAALPLRAQRPQIDLATELAADRRGLSAHADAILAGQPAEAQLLLHIDQFEELFTLAAESYRRSFIRLLEYSVTDARIRVLVTLRADFLPQCAAEPPLVALLQGGTFVLGPPGPEAMLDMIRRPAERAGLAFETGLAGDILRDAGGDSGEALPLVAFCLDELYRRTAPEHHLTIGAYRAMGRLPGAIGRRAGELLDSFGAPAPDEITLALRQVFRALVHVDATGKAARRRVPREALMTAPDPVPRLVQALINGRLLLAEGAAGHAVVTLTHEALIDEWPALRDWLERDRTIMQRVQRQLLHLASPDAQDRQHAAEALGRIGPTASEALPALCAAICDPEWTIRRAVIEAIGHISPAGAPVLSALIAVLRDDKPQVRAAATIVLGQVGEPAVAALLIAVADADETVRREATDALTRIDPPPTAALPSLGAALRNNPDARVRRIAVNLLLRIGLSAVGVYREFIMALRDSDHRVRATAAFALGGASTAVVPFLAESLRDPDGTVRRAAAHSLGRIGKDAAPALLAALRAADADPNLRVAALTGLMRLGADAAEAVPALVTSLGDANWAICRSAADALAAVGQAAVPGLVGALRDPNPQVRMTAIDILRGIEPPPQAAVLELAQMLADPHPEIVIAAAEAMGEIGFVPAAAVTELVKMLNAAGAASDKRRTIMALGNVGPAAVAPLLAVVADTDGDLQRTAFEALAKMGPAAIPALTDTLRDTSAANRPAAAQVLGDSRGMTPPEVVTALADALSDGYRPVRLEAAYALASIRSRAAAAAVPQLDDAARDPDPDVRRAAIFALGRIGPGSVSAVPTVVDALRDGDALVRGAAIGAIALIGPTSVPALIVELKSDDETTRCTAAAALGHIGSRALASVVPLTAALGDRSALMRAAAAHALGRIGAGASAATPTLAAILASDTEGVNAPAADALVAIGTAAIPSLITALRDGDPQRRAVLAAASRQIDPQLLADLLVAMADIDQDILEELGNLALPGLVDRMVDTNPSTAQTATTLVVRVGASALPILVEGLRGSYWPRWVASAEALGRMGPVASEAVAALGDDLVGDTDLLVRLSAARALIGIGPEAVPTLVLALRHADRVVRWVAVRALWRIGTHVAGVANALAAARDDSDADVRFSALRALKRSYTHTST
jgi:HEAT repeat protein